MSNPALSKYTDEAVRFLQMGPGSNGKVRASVDLFGKELGGRASGGSLFGRCGSKEHSKC